MPKEQTWLFISDLHAGSTTGLTCNPKNKIQEALLDRYEDMLNWAGRVDVVVVVGDFFDGKDKKGGDVTEPDVQKQIQDAAGLVAMVKPGKEAILVAGTAYHQEHEGQEFYELARDSFALKFRELGLRAKVSYTQKLKTRVNGWMRVEARHFVGGSGIPHGRATAILREQLWGVLNASYDAKMKGTAIAYPHLLVYGHRHHWTAAETAFGTAVILPAWQALGGKFGTMLCSGHVDLGAMRVTIGATEAIGWRREQKLYAAGVVERTENR